MAPPRSHYVAPGPKILEEGRTELKLYPKDLNIIWGNDGRYWRLPIEQEGSAELIQVCWLELNGVVKVKPGKYKISFCVTLKPDSFGWNARKTFVMGKEGVRGSYVHRPANLSIQSAGERITLTLPNVGGDLIVDIANKDGDNAFKPLHFGLYEVWSGKWKGGLEIHYATIQKVE